MRVTIIGILYTVPGCMRVYLHAQSVIAEVAQNDFTLVHTDFVDNTDYMQCLCQFFTQLALQTLPPTILTHFGAILQ